MKTHLRTISPLLVLGLSGIGSHAAVEVPAADASFTPKGTLLAITSTRPTETLGTVELNSPEFTASPSHGFPGNNATAWANYWSPNGTAKENTRAAFTNNAAAVHTITFSPDDLPNGSIIHGVYVRWVGQGNHSNDVSYSYTMGENSDSVTKNQMISEVGPSFSWTDSESVKRTLGFDTLFDEDITVSGGNGFTLTIARVSGQNVIRTDTVIIDATIGGSASNLQLVITRNPDTPDSYDFEWESQPGKLYDLLTSTDLADPLAVWPIYDDGETPYKEIPAAGETTTLTAVLSTDPRRFFAVREYDVPPPPALLEENFEDTAGPGPPAGWTRSDNGAGTAWEVGTPAGGAQFVPGAAAVGTKCAGTNINAQYTANAEASFVSPAFTVPESGATLSYWQYIDTEVSPSGDLGSIRLLDADGNFLADVVTGIEGVTTNWTRESVDLPAPANGLEVKLEFRFVSDAEENWGGFYIDDVLVTQL